MCEYVFGAVRNMSLLKHIARDRASDYAYLADAIAKEDLDKHKKNTTLRQLGNQRDAVLDRPEAAGSAESGVRQAAAGRAAVRQHAAGAAVRARQHHEDGQVQSGLSR